jgi:nicotinamidase/pyrazinamidase
MAASSCLVIVDVQRDFLPGGALAVPRGELVIPVINRLMRHFELIVATKDWHPPTHVSFAANHPGHVPGDLIEIDGGAQILWPVHCVQETAGAEFGSGLDVSRLQQIILKGTDPAIDSYSAFFDNARRRSTGLEGFLKQREISQVYLCGLATDYCVLYSALDALSLSLQTCVIRDACQGIDLQPGDSDKALATLAAKGAGLVESGVFG